MRDFTGWVSNVLQQVVISSSRTAAAIGAILTWATLALQFFLTVSSAVESGRGIAHGLFLYFGYFTILTNTYVGLTLTAHATGAIGFFRSPNSTASATAAIMVVGIGYLVLLSGHWSPTGLTLLADILLHYAVPLYMLGFWLVVGAGHNLDFASIPLWLSYPLGYFIYVILRGALTGEYPYYFLDPTALGYVGLLKNSLGLIALFVVISALMVVYSRWLRSSSKR
jgi:hypothetical protein